MFTYEARFTAGLPLTSPAVYVILILVKPLGKVVISFFWRRGLQPLPLFKRQLDDSTTTEDFLRN